MEQASPEASSSTPSVAKTLWFGAGIFCVFLFAQVFDDVRHGHENLFLLFGAPFWLGACGVASGSGRLLWRLFPHLAPSRRFAKPEQLPVLLGALCGLVLALAWGKSPLFALCYDSGKWMLLLLLAGWALGIVFQSGGLMNVALSFVAGTFCALIALVVFFLFSLSQAPDDVWRGTGMLAALGVPFAVSVLLYDCTRFAQLPAAKPAS